ncbi:hypothetical protein I6F35_20800 [Bradyrhizobium sp. BRP22]|uniref:hypothetical protein n=1 Tax=Bradyrhizobium sp. BRP22 TaxID=2793821 RepID=UPI001CD1C130|nr:hypothetical protein [Bradyrhizobium sp. BRP22]MCA1455618.1 hypothetical protein [Bradyrhizobium sp. BRP22]
MRIAGWVLLLAGFVLCLSVAWAALGFLLMGIGLVSLQVDERKRRKAEEAAAIAVAGPDASPEPAAALAEAPPVHAEAAPATPEPPPLPAAEATQRADASAYDKETWHRLVESDPDLARLVAVLADYGQHHVDEFASNYLAKPDKSRLAVIVNEIIAKAARKESAPAPPEVRRPSIDTNQQPPSPLARTEPDRSPAKIHAPKVAAVPSAAADVRNGTAARIRIASEIRPEPNSEGDNDRIAAPEDDLSELIRKFANDASFVRR